jgi:signal transduction histidine kinase
MSSSHARSPRPQPAGGFHSADERALIERLLPSPSDPIASIPLAFELEAVPAAGRELAACLVRLSALSALFGGEPPQAILDGVLDALVGMLDLDAAYAELAATEHHARVTAARATGGAGLPEAALAAALAPWMSAPAPAAPLLIAHPNGVDTLQALYLPIGLREGCALLAASARAGFPSSAEKLVLLLAAKQAHLSIAHTHAALAHERARQELARAYESEREACAQTQRTLHDHEIFAGILAHDLRGPLNAILTTAQVLLRKVEAERVAPGLARIVASGERMLRLIEQLLDFTRIRVGGGIALRPAPVDLLALARAALSEIEAAYPDWTLHLRATGDLQGTWDADRLAQVLYNLLSNGVQHGVRDGGLTIELDGDDAAHVRVRVHNHGCIPREIRDRVFDAFRGTEKPREHGAGLGLGLFITQQIVHAHHGVIAVESSEDGGTTFSVRLPRSAPAA